MDSEEVLLLAFFPLEKEGMSRPITVDEVKTYADALIIQYIEKKGATELPQSLASLKIRDSESNDILPIVLEKELRFDTVLENIIHQHLTTAFDDRDVDISSPAIKIEKGTSIPLRRASQRHSLTLQRNSSLPELSESPSNATPTRRSTVKRLVSASVGGLKTPPNATSSSASRRKNNQTSPFIRKRPSQKEKRQRPSTAPARPSHTSSRGKCRSKENWIPDHVREKMVQRDLSVAKRNLEFNDMYKGKDSDRRMSPLERNLTKEKYGLAVRTQCGLCCRLYLPVNLVMGLPQKAVHDIRETWGDKFDPAGRTVCANPHRHPSAMYDRTRVCAFCSQLFENQQDSYRPSFEMKEAEKELANAVERERTHEIMSDPLKQLDSERAHEIMDAEISAKNSIACKS